MRAAMITRVDAEAASPANEFGMYRFLEWEARPPHERAVGKDPEIVRTRHCYPDSIFPFLTAADAPDCTPRPKSGAAVSWPA